jgi:DNA-binding winged helix-turn-helix (wHTH) protein/tetratricopeptide (TPR) repeat protein
VTAVHVANREAGSVILGFADVELHLDRYELWRSGAPVAVEPQVFDVLVHLATNAERVVPKEELLDEIWGDRFVSESALTSRIKSARRAVGDDGSSQRIIRTVHGRGYRLIADVRELPDPSAAQTTDGERAGGARPLLEREAVLAQLTAAVRAAGDGAGRVVFVAGEAGLGKTAVVQRFAEVVADDAEVLIGAADDLRTPRALGAIRDVVDQLPAEVRAGQVGPPDAEQVLAVLERLGRGSGRPVVVVVEDAHWADDATFDVVRYLARRVRELPLVVVLTYRDDLPLGHPMRALLGSVRGPEVSRIALAPLSFEGVAALAAGSALDPQEVFRATAGNPLFVSEVCAAPPGTVPDTVRDAVLARVGQLPPTTVDALRRLAVVPNRVERELARQLVDDGESAWTEAERAGLLDGDAAHVWFRHELVRRAVEETLTASESVLAHREVASLLVAGGGEASRVVHHAALGTDIDLVLAAGPVAAAEAQRAGAHRQAAMHLDTVLAHHDRLPPARQAELGTARAHSLYLVNRFDASLNSAEQALAAAELAEDAELLAAALLTKARTLLWAHGPRAAVDVEQRALDVLGDGGDPELRALGHADLARALGELVSVGSVAQGNALAVEHAGRALALADELGRDDLRGYALMYRGCERVALGDDAGQADIDRAIALLRTFPRVDLAVRACVNASGAAYRAGRFGDAERYVDLGLHLGRDSEFFSGQYRLSLTRACVRASSGRWTEADAELRTLLALNGEPGIMRPLARTVLARLLARQGRHVEAASVLAPAEGDAPADEIRVAGPVALARVELAWLSETDVDLALLAAPILEHADRARGTVIRAELSRYLQRAGIPAEPVERAPEPWASGLRGDWRAAASAWAARGEPYEQALDLVSGGDPSARASGLDLLRSLGATAALTALGY